jgi:hypothetical protein
MSNTLGTKTDLPLVVGEPRVFITAMDKSAVSRLTTSLLRISPSVRF